MSFIQVLPSSINFSCSSRNTASGVFPSLFLSSMYFGWTTFFTSYIGH
uniref:Ankyrin repeat-containing protein At3g12360-like isoform X1 n=1 Tax=Rhizophora mucronata TaxID=61149 RepID=A0A2P2MNU3_RHIMU